MKISEILTAFAICALLTMGCRKEYSCENCQPVPDLKGTWKLVHFNVSVLGSTSYVTSDGPWMSSAEYKTITTKNEGIYTIDDQYINATGISCGSTTAPVTITIEQNGNRTVKEDGGFFWFIFPYNATIQYQRIGKDSLYFPGNGLLFMPDAQSWVIWRPRPGGGKFSIEGNILSIYTVVNRDSTFFESGIYQHVTQKDSGYIRLERQ